MKGKAVRKAEKDSARVTRQSQMKSCDLGRRQTRSSDSKTSPTSLKTHKHTTSTTSSKMQNRVKEKSASQMVLTDFFKTENIDSQGIRQKPLKKSLCLTQCEVHGSSKASKSKISSSQVKATSQKTLGLSCKEVEMEDRESKEEKMTFDQLVSGINKKQLRPCQIDSTPISPALTASKKHSTQSVPATPTTKSPCARRTRSMPVTPTSNRHTTSKIKQDEAAAQFGRAIKNQSRKSNTKGKFAINSKDTETSGALISSKKDSTQAPVTQSPITRGTRNTPAMPTSDRIVTSNKMIERAMPSEPLHSETKKKRGKPSKKEQLSLSSNVAKSPAPLKSKKYLTRSVPDTPTFESTCARSTRSMPVTPTTDCHASRNKTGKYEITSTQLNSAIKSKNVKLGKKEEFVTSLNVAVKSPATLASKCSTQRLPVTCKSNSLIKRQTRSMPVTPINDNNKTNNATTEDEKPTENTTKKKRGRHGKKEQSLSPNITKSPIATTSENPIPASLFVAFNNVQTSRGKVDEGKVLSTHSDNAVKRKSGRACKDKQSSPLSKLATGPALVKLGRSSTDNTKTEAEMYSELSDTPAKRKRGKPSENEQSSLTTKIASVNRAIIKPDDSTMNATDESVLPDTTVKNRKGRHSNKEQALLLSYVTKTSPDQTTSKRHSKQKVAVTQARSPGRTRSVSAMSSKSSSTTRSMHITQSSENYTQTSVTVTAVSVSHTTNEMSVTSGNPVTSDRSVTLISESHTTSNYGEDSPGVTMVGMITYYISLF